MCQIKSAGGAKDRLDMGDERNAGMGNLMPGQAERSGRNKGNH